MNDKLYERAVQLYGDEELAQAVFEDADKQGHGDKIASGELVLPHPVDARKWHDRIRGRDNETPSEREAHRKIRELEDRLKAMTPQPET